MSASILYLHGFNSSSVSIKAQLFLEYCRFHHPTVDVHIPDLSVDPKQAVVQMESIVDTCNVRLVIGSSLGGYYASWLSEKYNCKAVLINPAVSPHRTLDARFVGTHKNPNTSEVYELTWAHVNFLETLETEKIRIPSNFLVLLQTGDEVLDYRHAVEKYQECELVVQDGGSHAFTDFSKMLPQILDFSGLV